MTGDNTDLSMNFIPKLDYRLLINGYKRVVASYTLQRPITREL